MPQPLPDPSLPGDVPPNRRILIVDDNEAIHADFRKILLPQEISETGADFEAEMDELFGESDKNEKKAQSVSFELDFATQGQEALERVKQAVAENRRYAMAFMDVRMPPGWDGLVTTGKLWECDPDLQIVICTAYSDYSWEEMMSTLGTSERVLILKKPFDSIEVLQLAHALTEKWALLQAARRTTEALEKAVFERTRELREANSQLKEEIEKNEIASRHIRELALLVEKAREGIVVRDLEDTIQFWNQGAERLYGWNANEAVGRKVADLLYSGAAGEDRSKARAEVLEKGSWTGTLFPKTKEGQDITVESHWTLILDEGGQPKSVLEIDSDITEKKQIESRLLRAQRLESIGTLASGVAHYLNNTLTPIIMSAPFLRDPISPEDFELTASTIETCAQRAADTVAQLICFAEGTAGMRVRVSPKPILHEIEKMVSDHFPKTISFKPQIAQELWMVECDPTQIQQVLVNLCVNARDAMEQGGTLTLTARNREVDSVFASSIPDAKAGKYVCIHVQDTGCGISEHNLQHIFDPFFTTKPLGKGTGLGLSNVAGIVKNHGGFFNVTSKEGAGTSFEIFLSAAAVLGAGEAAESSESPIGNGEIVLLVDEDEGILNAVKVLFLRNGYIRLSAPDGAEALMTYARYEGAIKAVVMDLSMPGFGVCQLGQAIRKKDPAIKIIATAAQGSDAQVGQADGVLAKPYRPEDLLGLLHRILNS